MLGRFVVVGVLCVTASFNYGDRIYSIYETADKIIADGFPAETHHVTTSDGYILEMHRIPYGRSGADTAEDRPVVFLMHGLLSASNSFIGLGPEDSFAYNFADAGCDVWMGNARGNKNSRYHISLDPDDELQKYPFFDFSFEEIGIYDLPAMIDYVLEFTKQEKLHYIGHSQGGTVFLVLNSLLPEYNQKIASAHLLAGVGYMEYFPNEDLKQTAALTDFIYGMALQSGVVELYPPNSTDMIPDGLFPYRTADYCAGDVNMRHMCQLIGVRHILRDDVIETAIQAGAALKQVAHYGQNIRDKIFRRFHYGTDENLSIYGSTNPPAYDLSRITSDVTMHYSLSDDLLDERDVLAMAADMPNTVARRVSRESFLHSDYVTALDAKELVTKFIISSVKNEGQESTPVYEYSSSSSSADTTYYDTTTDAPGSAHSYTAMTHVYLLIMSYCIILEGNLNI